MAESVEADDTLGFEAGGKSTDPANPWVIAGPLDSDTRLSGKRGMKNPTQPRNPSRPRTSSEKLNAFTEIFVSTDGPKRRYPRPTDAPPPPRERASSRSSRRLKMLVSSPGHNRPMLVDVPPRCLPGLGSVRVIMSWMCVEFLAKVAPSAPLRTRPVIWQLRGHRQTPRHHRAPTGLI
jgi:hypothetical protein